MSIVLFTHASYSQVFVEEQNINELDIQYIELVGVNSSMFGVKIKIFVDYGAPVKFMKGAKIKNSSGKDMKFNTMMHALNFMYENNWKYVNYTETIVGSKLRYVYLLEKK